jgi:hypothetical protein
MQIVFETCCLREHIICMQILRLDFGDSSHKKYGIPFPVSSSEFPAKQLTCGEALALYWELETLNWELEGGRSIIFKFG